MTLQDRDLPAQWLTPTVSEHEPMPDRIHAAGVAALGLIAAWPTWQILPSALTAAGKQSRQGRYAMALRIRTLLLGMGTWLLAGVAAAAPKPPPVTPGEREAVIAQLGTSAGTGIHRTGNG